MLRYRLIGLAAGTAGLFFLRSLAPGQESAGNPDELNRQAYITAREAAKALIRGEERRAYDKYLEAVEIYEKLSRQFPGWKPDVIETRLEECREKTAALEERVFKIPAGCVEIAPEMAREGERHSRGQSLVSGVSVLGEGRYGVAGCKVTLIREGPLLGAQCSCPDFKYRGSKYGYACEHIWAVILKENLIKTDN